MDKVSKVDTRLNEVRRSAQKIALAIDDVKYSSEVSNMLLSIRMRYQRWRSEYGYTIARSSNRVLSTNFGSPLVVNETAIQQYYSYKASVNALFILLIFDDTARSIVLSPISTIRPPKMSGLICQERLVAFMGRDRSTCPSTYLGNNF